MDAYVEPHLRWRFLAPQDGEAVESFRTQLEALDNSVLAGMTRAVLDNELESTGGLAVGGWDAYDSLSAFGAGFLVSKAPLRMYLVGGVHPVHRHMKIGTALLSWQINQAAMWRDEKHPGEALWLGCYAELGRPGLERVAGHLGFQAERYYYDLHRDLAASLTVPCASGITVDQFDADDAEAVRLLHNRCFRPIGGSEVTSDEWNQRLSESAFRPDWSFVARDGDRIVGYAMSVVDEGESLSGWTERFGVDEDYRRRGISMALLGNCLGAMRASGCTEAGIGIDTPDGFGLARLEAELGYTRRDAVALLSKVI